MVTSTVEQEELLASIRKNFQDSRNSLDMVIYYIGVYFENKYKCELKYLERGERLADDDEAQHINIPECNLKIADSSGDFELYFFMNKIRSIESMFDALKTQLDNLPGLANNVLDTAKLLEARANSLSNTSESDLQGIDNKTRVMIENNLIAIAKNMSSIINQVKELIASLAPV